MPTPCPTARPRNPRSEGPDDDAVLFKGPSLMRAEVEGGIVVIIDGSQGKHLILDPATKTALLLEGKAPEAPLGPAASIAERLRQLTEGDAKPVGEKPIGDIRALGYLVKKLGTEMTVWVNPATRLPVRIESTDRIQGKEIRATTHRLSNRPRDRRRVVPPRPPAGLHAPQGGIERTGDGREDLLEPREGDRGLPPHLRREDRRHVPQAASMT